MLVCLCRIDSERAYISSEIRAENAKKLICYFCMRSLEEYCDVMAEQFCSVYKFMHEHVWFSPFFFFFLLDYCRT